MNRPGSCTTYDQKGDHLMPTINQLIRKGRKAGENVSKSPALNRGYNSLKSRPTTLSSPQ